MPRRTKKIEASTEPTNYEKLFGAFGHQWSRNGSPEAVAETCPFCTDEGHCYLNVDTGLFDCKKCGASGNAVTFVRHQYALALEATTDDDYRELKDARGLPLQTLKRHGLAYHADRRSWLLPAKNKVGDVVNLILVTLRPPSKRYLPGLSTALFGLENLSSDTALPLFVCEGPWDGIALDYQMVRRKTRARYDILAAPSASIFKDTWTKFFEGRIVRLLFDNDEAGRKGQERASKLLGPVAREVWGLVWPAGTPEKCDIADLVRDNVSVVTFANEHSTRLAIPERRLTFVKGNAVPNENVEWLWHGRIPFRTFVSFSGERGTNKSTIVCDLVARSTAGAPMPNETRALPPFDVMYFTSEDSAANVRDLVGIAGGNLARLLVHDIAQSLDPIDLLDCLEEIEAEINALGVRLVIVDALNSFVGGDIRSDSAARRTLTGRLQSLARRTGACIIGIRNWGRSDTGTASQKALGATSLSDVARCTMNTKRTKLSHITFSMLEFERVTQAHPDLWRPVRYTIENLAKPGAEHLRRVSWGKPITPDALAELLRKKAET